MASLVYRGRPLPTVEGESVLDCLSRNDIPVRSSCRAGVCQACLVQGKSAPPPAAQKGLSRSLASQNYFLACQCPAAQSPELVDEDVRPVYSSRVHAVELLSPGIYRVLLERPEGFEFQGGQFVHVTRPSDGLTRSYSLASQPADPLLELHIARIPGGEMSTYLTTTVGALVQLRGPGGDCVYAGKQAESMVLVGTGTGLAPLLGVIRTALNEGHMGPIHLFHGATRPNRLYLRRELLRLQETNPNFHYEGDVLELDSAPVEESDEPPPSSRGLPNLLREKFPDLRDHRVYLCGNPDLVHALKKQCFLAGAPIRSIHSDPFVPSSPPPVPAG